MDDNKVTSLEGLMRYKSYVGSDGFGLVVKTREDATGDLVRFEDVERLLATQASIPAGWISVESALPEKYCLAVYENSRGRQNIIRAMYVGKFQIEASGDDCYTEINDENDTEYLREGWYELIDNWGEYSSVHVCEGVVTHWQPLPALPGAAPTSQAEPVVAGQQVAPVGHVVDIDRNCNESIINVALEPGTAIYLAAPSSLPMAADARDQSLEDRKLVLLKAAQELLHKQTESRYVLNLLSETVFYDDADCDGHCLMEDIGYLFDELDEKGQRPASQEGVSDE